MGWRVLPVLPHPGAVFLQAKHVALAQRPAQDKGAALNVHNESCLDTMARMPDNHLDLTVTSPPYDTIRAYEGLPFDTFMRIAAELYRVTKPGGVVVWVVGDEVRDGDESGTSFRQALHFKECGFNLHDTMIYSKGPKGARGGNQTYMHSFEYMFVFSKGRPKSIHLIRDRKQTARKTHTLLDRNRDGTRNRRTEKGYGTMGRRTNIWLYYTGLNNTTKDKVAFQHPAVFPDKLAADHIISWSDAGDLVYDPFMGSGTVAKMCVKLNRRYVGSEINPEYCKIIAERLHENLGRMEQYT